MDQEKTYKWIQDRLRDLHSGTLSEADRARLFELAHQDPFLKDALEGYQSSSQHDHALHLRNISHRIQKKGFAKRRTLLPDRRGWIMQAVAASLVLILVTWAVIYYLEDQDTNMLVATETEIEIPDESGRRLTEETKEIEADIASEESAGNEINDEPAGLRAHAIEKAEEAKSGSSSTLHVLDGVPVERRDEVLSEPAVSQPPATTYKQGQESVSEAVINESAAAATDQDAKAKDEGYYANQMSPAMMDKRITGQVIDAYGQAIPGAFIVLQNSNLATTSNLYGQFELFLPEAISKVEVSSTGYSDTIITVAQGKDDLVVILAEDVNAKNLAAQYSRENKIQAKTSSVPTKNNFSFLEYLKANSRYPISEQYTANSKEIVLEFSVAGNGRPEKVIALKTNAEKKYASEAVRLIENGPDWVCESVYPCVMRYTIYFR